MPPSFSLLQPSVQTLIDEHIALIMERKTGMAAFRETKLLVSRLSTVYPSMRLVVTILLRVYDALSAEAQRLSGYSGVPLQIILLGQGDSYLMTPTQAGVQPIMRTSGKGGFGGIANRVAGAGTQHMAFKAKCMRRSCRHCRRSLPRCSCRTPLMSALSAAAKLKSYVLAKIDVPAELCPDLDSRDSEVDVVLLPPGGPARELSAGGPACRVSVHPPPHSPTIPRTPCTQHS